MQFGKRLLALQHTPWAPHYLDYEHLKEILLQDQQEALQQTETTRLTDHADSNNSLDAVSVTSSRWTLSSKQNPVTAKFLTELHLQIESILLFVLQQEGLIASELDNCRKQIRQAHTDDFETIYQNYRDAGLHLLHLVQFVDLNLTGIRKIVKKHDKVTSTTIAHRFWAVRKTQLGASRLVEPLLLQDESSLGALVLIFETGLEELSCHVQQHKDAPLPLTAPQTQRKGQSSSEPPVPLIISSSPLPLSSALPPPPQPPPPLSPPPRPLGKQTRRSLTASFASVPPEAILLQIQAARRRLKQNNEFVQLLAAPLLIGDVTPESEGEQKDYILQEDAQKKAASSPISNTLNLLSTFFYMTNYYIVAPSSASYADKLGGDRAMAALIIGMMPIAALLSTILFSWWTNHSYKTALIFASTCSLIGNICYAAGLPLNSIVIVMVGRFLNGFGSSRSINRRYIADTFPRDERTAASAAFVTVGALGMSAGPAIASLLHLVPCHESNRFWQVENAPGWFMMMVWGVYLVCVIFCFSDPPKTRVLPITELTGEKSPLLATNDHDKVDLDPLASQSHVSLSILRNVPVITTFVIYFVLKLVLEAVISSCANVTAFYFDWEDSIAGIYLAVLGLLMLPANLCVAYLATQYQDRDLIVSIQGIMLLGCLGIMQYGTYYSVAQYILASVFIFVSSNALEGPNMSLLSKTIPASWSRGIFNVGLLATEAGTLGRAVGDVSLSLFGRGGLAHLLNRTFASFSVVCAVTLAASVWLYEYLEPMDKDD